MSAPDRYARRIFDEALSVLASSGAPTAFLDVVRWGGMAGFCLRVVADIGRKKDAKREEIERAIAELHELGAAERRWVDLATECAALMTAAKEKDRDDF